MRVVERRAQLRPPEPAGGELTTAVGHVFPAEDAQLQHLSRRELRTRSVHIFLGDIEYVIEAIAPPQDYRLVERRVMEPLLDSLELEGEVAGATG